MLRRTNRPSVPPLKVSRKARRTLEPPISFLIASAVRNPDLISLAAGLVDPQTLPRRELAVQARRLLSDAPAATAALQYDTTIGLTGLREALLEHLCALEGVAAARMNLSADDIAVTTGSQQSLYLIADVLLNPGDIVIAASPSYFVFAGVLQSLGARLLTVPMDQDGMQVAEVDRLLQRLRRTGELPRVKFIYCTSYYQNPTGLTLSLPRRRQLLQIAKKYSTGHRILILEDAAYRELRYDGRALRSIKSFDRENLWTILTQTFSKPFAPGLKTGYTAMPRDLMERFLQQKGNHDFGSPSLCQHLILGALRDGSYSRHVQRLCVSYRRKRDAMLAALKRWMPHGRAIHWTHPGGGLYVWLTLPPEISAGRDSVLFARCLEEGVLYVPGEYAFVPDAQGNCPANHLRLSFGHVPLRAIAPAIRRLAKAIAQTKETGAPR